METSQRSSVPYSLSDIQLPESPGKLCSKSAKDDEKSKKAVSSNKDIKPNGVSPRNDSSSERSYSESESGEVGSQSDSPVKERPRRYKDDNRQKESSGDESGRNKSKSDEKCKVSSTPVQAEDNKDTSKKILKSSRMLSDENESNKSAEGNKLKRSYIKQEKDSKHKTEDSKHKSDDSKLKFDDSKLKFDDSKHKFCDSKLKSDDINIKQEPEDCKGKIEDVKQKIEDSKQKIDGNKLKSNSKHRFNDKQNPEDKHKSNKDKHKSENSKPKVDDSEHNPLDRQMSDSKHKPDDHSNLKLEDRKCKSEDSKAKSGNSKDKSRDCIEKSDGKQKPGDRQQYHGKEKNVTIKEKIESKPTKQRRQSPAEDKNILKSRRSERERTSKLKYSNSEDDQSSDSDTKHRRVDSKLKIVVKPERESSPSSSSSNSSSERRHSRRLTSDSHGKDLVKREDIHIIDKKSIKAESTVKRTEISEPKSEPKNDPPRKRLKVKRDNVTVESPSIKKRLESPPRKSVEISSMPVSKPETKKPVKVEISDPKIEAHEIPYVPRKVSLANRTLSRKSSEEASTESYAKKSKWGSIAAVQKSSQTISISTDSLKTWFPEFKLINEPTTSMELDAEDHSLPALSEQQPQPSQSEDLEENDSSDKHPSMSKENNDKEEGAPTLEAIEEEVISKPGDVSKMIFIQNLVRPFTLNQLKELLKQSGNVVEEYFWIDKIKSKCFVMYETEKEAIKARNALNNTRWPSSNPKILSVQFSNEEELERHKKGNEPPPKPIPEIKEPSEPGEFIKSRDRLVEEPRRKEKEHRREKDRDFMREWDRDKISQVSPERGHMSKEDKSRSSEKKDRKESKKRPSDDTSAKLLDDLFMKTKSTPCIYWLPLTEEQVKEKEEEQLKRKMEREKRIKQKEQEDADRRSKRARSSRRSREKVSRKSSTRSRSPASRRR